MTGSLPAATSPRAAQGRRATQDVRAAQGVRRSAVLVGVGGLLLLAAGGCSSGSATSAGEARTRLGDGTATRSAPPPTEAATGRLVRDFPSQLLPLPPRATVTASAVQRHEGLMDVSVSATTPAPTKEVLGFYSAALARAGFSQTKGSMLPLGTLGLAFSRNGGQELVVVAVADRGTDRSFSLGGTVAGDGFRPGGLSDVDETG